MLLSLQIGLGVFLGGILLAFATTAAVKVHGWREKQRQRKRCGL